MHCEPERPSSNHVGARGPTAEQASEQQASRQPSVASVLDLQRSVGNAAVARLLDADRAGSSSVARSPAFSAETKRSPDVDYTTLGGTAEVDAAVTNARAAPRGTKFAWDWATVDDAKLVKGPTPPEGPRAKLKAKAKKVGDAEVTAAVDIQAPDGQQSTEFTKPTTVVVQPPEVEWQTFTQYGVRAPGASREGGGTGERMYVGDTLSVMARLKGDVSGADGGLMLRAQSLKGGSRGISVAPGSWSEPSVAGWDITAVTPGASQVRLELHGPGLPQPITHDVQVGAVADPAFFKGRCSTAETRLNELHAAGREWFMAASESYQTGYQRHAAALEAQKAKDKLVEDLIWGVLFAGIGGAAGGWIGGRMKNAVTLKSALSPVQLDTLTDAAKDLGKYASRLPSNSRIRDRGASGGGANSGGQHEGADPADAGAAVGTAKPAGLDPLRWMTRIDKKIAGERRKVGGILSHYQEAADAELAYPQADNPFDLDPVEIIEQSATIDGKPITALGEIPTADDYEQAFWITWIQTYAYKVKYIGTKAGGKAILKDNIGKDLEKAINVIAKKFGTTGEAWIETYGGVARRAAQETIDNSGLLLQ